MKKTAFFLALSFLATYTYSQCPGQTIPNDAQSITGSSTQKTSSNKSYWVCSNAALNLKGTHNTVYAEDSAIVSIDGDTNTVYQKFPGTLVIAGNKNTVYRESGLTYTNNGNGTNGTVCPGIQIFFYHDAPKPGCPNIVGIEDYVISSKIKVYPNPASNLLTIELPEEISGDAAISIYSIDGKRISSNQFYGLNDVVKLDISTYAPGLYLVRIQSGDFQHSRQISIE